MKMQIFNKNDIVKVKDELYHNKHFVGLYGNSKNMIGKVIDYSENGLFVYVKLNGNYTEPTMFYEMDLELVEKNMDVKIRKKKFAYSAIPIDEWKQKGEDLLIKEIKAKDEYAEYTDFFFDPYSEMIYGKVRIIMWMYYFE